MPKCSYRKYTVSEIINAVIKFDEHTAWTNEKIPGVFTVTAVKYVQNGITAKTIC